jgi:uncharacterized protein (TIGR03000 family)
MYSAVLMLALTAGSESVDFGRHRCHGCAAECSGPVVVGCTAPVGCSAPVDCSSSCHARHGLFSRLGHRKHRCHGDAVCSAPVACCGGAVIVAPPGPGPAPKAMPGEPIPPPAPKKTTRSFAPATILVSLPTGARLSVDGTPTSSTAEYRSLVTPALEVGATYVYTLRAEMVDNGQTVTQTRIVNVRGGTTSAVHFNFSSQNVASR